MSALKKVKFSKSFELPVIDVSILTHGSEDEKSLVGAQIADACRAHGFFYIKNFGISANKIRDCFSQSQSFFRQGADYKDKYSIEHNDRFQGYEPPTETESKEAYVLGPERADDDVLVQQGIKYHGANQWPDLPGWKDVMLGQMHDMLGLAKLLNRGLALGLGIPEGYFDERSKDPMYAFRLLSYPPKEVKAGIESHTDWGALSLLIQDGTPGLEILNADGSWSLVPPIDNTMVVNVGEMVEIWTNGEIKATPHRVINRSNKTRFSIAFFLDMDHNSILEPVLIGESSKPQYKPVRVSDFIDAMHKRDYGTNDV